MNLRLHVAVAATGERQQDIAARAGIKGMDFSRYKNGQRKPNETVKQRIADALNMTVEELFDDEAKVS